MAHHPPPDTNARTATASERHLLADVVANGGTLSAAGGEGTYYFTTLRGNCPSKAFTEKRFVMADVADLLHQKGFVAIVRRGRSIQLRVTELGKQEAQ